MSITLDTIDAGFHSIKISDGTDTLGINSDGSINAVVTATNLDIRDLTSVSDSVAAVQSGTWSVDVANTVTVTATNLDIRDLSSASDSVSAVQSGVWTVNEGAYGSWKVSKSAVSTTAVQLAATALTGRLKAVIQNLGSVDVYVKNANTVSVDDLKIPKGSSQEIELGASAAIWAISASGTADIRIAEYAA